MYVGHQPAFSVHLMMNWQGGDSPGFGILNSAKIKGGYQDQQA